MINLSTQKRYTLNVVWPKARFISFSFLLYATVTVQRVWLHAHALSVYTLHLSNGGRRLQRWPNTIIYHRSSE